MPGAPNRPPEMDTAVPVQDPTARRLLRKMAPMRVALHLDVWKSAPSSELVVLLERAESNLASGDFVTAQNNVDQLAIRFAEPRWPTMPIPFKSLRVEIPPPTPPHWNPEHALAPADKELKRLAREGETHVALARATIAWAPKHQIELADVAPTVERAQATLAAGGPTEPFWVDIDAFWQTVRDRVPMPKSTGKAAGPAKAASPAETA
jgi:hypothetical protein